MQVQIIRRWETSRSVCGEMWVDGAFGFFTLEPARKDPVVPGHPCIPAGTYPVVLTKSPHLHYTTPEVMNVPGRTGIRWHIGNFPEDVEGCAAVGSTHAVDFVGRSRSAFSALMAKLPPTEAIVAEYLERIETIC